MKLKKTISAFLALICLFATFGLCTLGVSAAEGSRTVYATTSTSVTQGSYGYLYVYLDDLTDLSALGVSIYYDTEKITVKSVYNQASSVVNDITTGDGCVNASYIFDGNGAAIQTNLFYIYYQVNNSAEIGDTYFDIVVNEAYNSSLEEMDFAGSRCTLEIAEKTVNNSCSINSTSSVSTSVEEEFELSYRLSTYQIASGSMNIQYDPELFEVVTVVNGGFLNSKIADVNTALDGSISISFVGTEYQYGYDIITVRFKTLKNVTETSDIKLVVSELYDKELNLYSCSGYTTKANVVFDETYTEDAPSTSVSSSYNAETGKVTATIELEENSMLGAGDFVLKFDTNYLTYSSAGKGFSPSFFNINDKNIADGVLKFSIISLSDLTDEQIILTVVFDAKHACQDKTTDFEISGSGLTDSLTNTIMLNFVDANVTIPLKHTEATANVENRVAPSCTENGSYDSVVYCSVCDVELSRETKTIDKLGHDPSAEWTVDVEPTCTTAGSKSHHCSRCGDKSDVTAILANGHSYGEWYEIKSPTCTADGSEERECSACNTKETRVIAANGHTNAIPIIENRIEPDCTTEGNYDSVVYCSVCDTEISRESKVISALGHNYEIDWTVDLTPTCTEKGSKSHHCTRCEDKLDVTEIPATGHSFGAWHETKAPTCTEEGTEEHECSSCHTKEKRAIVANGHTNAIPVIENRVEPDCTTEGSYDSVVYCSVCKEELSRESKVIDKLGHNEILHIGKAATCTDSGYKDYVTCSRCDYNTYETIPALGHEEVFYSAKAPTCAEIGWEAYFICSTCGYTTYVEMPALGHTYSEWIIDVEATFETDGKKHKECTVCQEILEESVIPMLKHSYTSVVTPPTCTERGYTTHTCLECGNTYMDDYVPASGHNYDIEWTVDISPTCTEKGSMSHHCTRCDSSIEATELPATGHDEIVSEALAPTCTESGLTEGKYCSKCKEILTYQQVIPALGHVVVIDDAVEPTCTDMGLAEGNHCSRCSEILTAQAVVPALGHSYDAVVIEPTCTEQGYTTHTCKVCAESYISDWTSAHGHSWLEATTESPKTCEACGETEGDMLPEPTPDPDPEPDPEPEKDHDECKEKANGWKKFWRAIGNFFRMIVGLPKKCVCGDEL